MARIFVFLLILALVELQVEGMTMRISPSRSIYAKKYNLVYFRCQVEGPEKPVITWAFNGKVITKPPPYALKWVEGGIMMIRPLFVGRSDGFYECIASDGKRTIRKGFRLTVTEEKDLPVGFPKFTTQPRSIYPTEGETVTLQCKASGIPKPKIQWFMARKPINVSHPRIRLLSDNTLEFRDIRMMDRDLIECEAANSLGRLISHRVGIFARQRKVIKIKPKLVTTQKDISVDPESSITLVCTATGKPQPAFSWYRNGILLADGTDGRLRLPYVLKSYNYTCRARNDAGYEESTMRLTVIPKPLPPSSPKRLRDNSSSITITWSKHFQETNEITGWIIKYRSRGTQKWSQATVKAPSMEFTLGGLKPYTFWDFQIIAVNNAGQSRPGKIDWWTSGETVPESPAWGLLGKGVSDTSFNATWNKPLIPNGPIQRYRVYYTVDKTDPLTDWSLEYAGTTWKIIRRTQRRTIYYFKIQAVGTKGVGPMSEVAIVKAQAGVPGQPLNLTAEAKSSRSILVTWKNPVFHGNGLDGNEVQYKSQIGSFKKASEFGLTSNLLQNLNPFTNYTINVLAKSFGGLGPPSEPIYCMTMEDKPSGPPQGSRARPRSSTSIEVFWNPPKHALQNGVIVGYNIMYTPIRGSTPSILSVDGSKKKAMLTGLRKFTKYTIWVSSLTSVGEGPPSNKFELFTDEDVPEGAPRNIRAQAMNDSAISVSWDEPIEKSGRIRGYFVYYLPVADDHQILKDKTLPYRYDAVGSQQRRAVLIKDVEPSTTYQIRVAAYTLIGDGTRSIKQYVKTPKRLPAAPEIRWATLKNKSTTDLDLAWRPNYPGVLQYKIVYGKSLAKFDNLASVRTKYVDVSKRAWKFKNLDYGVWYCFRVSAQTAKDWSSEARVWVRMPDGKPGEAPQNIRAITVSSTSIKVLWESPDPWLRNGEITKYVVSYKITANGELRTKTLSVKDNNQRLRLVIGSLQVKTEYMFKVKAFTSAGKGPSSLSVTAKTDDQVLPFVRSVSVSGITSNSALIKWVAPTPTADIKITGYKVTAAGSKSYKDTLGVERRVRSNGEQIIPATLNSAFFKNLKPYLYYTVSVWVQTTSGTGQRKVIQFWTKKSAPPAVEPPKGLKIVDGFKVSLVVAPSSIENGEIDFYHLYVVDYGTNYLKSSISSNNPDELLRGGQRKRRSSSTPKAYIAAELQQNELPKEIIIGEGNEIGGRQNKELIPGHTYRFFCKSYVKQITGYISKSSNITTAVTLDSKPVTRDTDDNSVEARTGKTGMNNAKSQESESKGNGVLIAGVVTSLVLVIAVIVLGVCLKRRGVCKSNQQKDEECRKPLQGRNNSMKDDKPKDLVELHRMKYPTAEMMTHPPIPVADFAHHVMSMKADDAEKIVQEFESFDPDLRYISEASNQPFNKMKNRYPNLQAYDHTRVKLELTGEIGSDYFNANFIDGYCREKSFIATQGPMQNTVADFWRACWENKTSTIVMMTKLEEKGRSKCEQYWPSSGIAMYGKIRVGKIDQFQLANYTKRTFEIACVDGAETRVVKQFQFTAWPDTGVPRNAAALLTFTERVRKENGDNTGPIIVHCSAGVGRTGCFIVIYSMLERIKNEQTVDIYGYVTMLRSQRNFMVQNDEQYMFVHDAILDAIQSGDTEVTSGNFSDYYKKMSEFNKQDGDELIGKDFNTIVNITVPDTANSTTGHNLANKLKNRWPSIVPYDLNRVCLGQLRGQDGAEYINASHVDGYRKRNEFITAQGPTKETAEDFWRMIVEQDCSIIVMLTNLTDQGKEMCHKYWPTQKSERYHYYVVEPGTETRELNFFIRKFKVTDARDGDTRVITQFQYINFHKNEVPISPEGIIQLIGHVNKLRNEQNNSGPILCHSNSGVGRTGVFIALSIIFERLQAEDVIDIHQTVKTLRFERAFMVQNLQQYRFCFEAADSFIKNFELVV